MFFWFQLINNRQECIDAHPPVFVYRPVLILSEATPYGQFVVVDLMIISSVCVKLVMGRVVCFYTPSHQSQGLFTGTNPNSKRSLRYNGAILYNTLNSNIQECDTLGAFKYKVFKSFM